MSFDALTGVGNVKGDFRQRFENEKNAALNAAQGNPALISRINGVTPHKGAIEELEALLLEATRSQNSPPPGRTLGIG